MKKIFILTFFALMGFYGNAAVKSAVLLNPVGTPELTNLDAAFSQMSPESILKLTPKQYRAMTGKKLSLKQVIALKAAQSQLKKQAAGSGLSKGLYIVLVIFGWAFLAIGILTDWKGNDWVIGLVLFILVPCLGSLIYGLIKMKNYY